MKRFGRADDARITGADVGTAGFLITAQLAHRVHAAADSILRFDDPRIDARGLQLQRRGQSREAGADDDRVMLVNLGQASVPGTPHSAGFGSPGRPDRQQSAGQKSWLGPSLPKLSRSEFELMRSSMSSRTMPT